jgi:hypothetical protein
MDQPLMTLRHNVIQFKIAHFGTHARDHSVRVYNCSAFMHPEIGDSEFISFCSFDFKDWSSAGRQKIVTLQ